MADVDAAVLSRPALVKSHLLAIPKTPPRPQPIQLKLPLKLRRPPRLKVSQPTPCNRLRELTAPNVRTNDRPVLTAPRPNRSRRAVRPYLPGRLSNACSV